MSELVIFTIGIFVFAITVYGVVVAGGLLLTREAIEDNPQFARRVDPDQLDATLPTDARF